YALVHVLMGARHVCPVSGGFDPAEILDLAAHHGRIHMFAAPTMVKRMTAYAQSQGQGGAGLRTIVYGGGPMYVADIVEAVAVFGPVFVQIYGQGECPMSITALSRADVTDRSHAAWRNLGSRIVWHFYRTVFRNPVTPTPFRIITRAVTASRSK
ncbi:MAG: AMP-binding protein, partial [Paracoccaceae bacterium]|nr:AMP-binding protein [Paracoccaceae bacterium]